MILVVLRVVALAAGLISGPSRVEPSSALAHAIAAELASTERVTTELLLGVAHVESNYYRDATSYVVDGRRVGGRWPSTAPAGSGPRFCGPLQTIAGKSWKRCLAQRDLMVGYRTGAAELAEWLRISRGNLRAALRGYACGVAGLRGPCKAYDVRVLRGAGRLRRLTQRIR